jgi:hypothetical protein
MKITSLVPTVAASDRAFGNSVLVAVALAFVAGMMNRRRNG